MQATQLSPSQLMVENHTRRRSRNWAKGGPQISQDPVLLHLRWAAGGPQISQDQVLLHLRWAAEDLRSARTQYFCPFVGQREDFRSARTQYFCIFVGQREDLRSARTKYSGIFKIDALSAKCIQFGVKPILSNKYEAEASSMTLCRVPSSGAPKGRGGA